MKIIKNITVERAKRGWTMKDVADKMGITRPMISYYESGEHIPSPARRKQLEEVFEVDSIHLLSEVSK